MKEEVDRQMWCTGGILHIVALTVTEDGSILSLKQAGDRSVFSFDPIEVQCGERGITRWQDHLQSTKQKIYHVRNLKAYEDAMTPALKTLLATSLGYTKR